MTVALTGFAADGAAGSPAPGPAHRASRAVAVRVSPHVAVLTVRHRRRPHYVLVHGNGGWHFARRVVFRPRRLRATLPVSRHARRLRVLLVSGHHRSRLRKTHLRVALQAAPPCGPLVAPAPGERPPACWRPYAAESPFNLELPAEPRLAERSAAIVAGVTSHGPPQHLPAGWAGTDDDWGRPTYFSRPGDPEYVVHCTRPWGTCPIEGRTVRIPADARPAGGGDAHLTVVDPVTRWEYGLWQVRPRRDGGGRLDVGYGGRTRIDGDGIGSDRVNGGNAAGFGSAAGLLRAEELAAGRIEHALFITVLCDNGTYVYPAVHSGMPCPTAEQRAAAPAMGQRLQLAMSDAEIDDLPAPAWKRAILRAMAHYGMVVGDTGGDSWALGFESGVEYLSFGRPDRWVQLARDWELPYDWSTGSFAFVFRDGVDWPRRLRVVAPCVSARVC